MQKTELGFYLITDKEYYNLEQPEQDVIYVLVNNTDDQYLVLKNGQFLGKIDKELKQMSMTAKAMGRSDTTTVQKNTNAFAGLKPVSGTVLPIHTVAPDLKPVVGNVLPIVEEKKVEEKKPAVTTKKRRRR